METAKDTTRIRRNLLRWYQQNGRSFPWRSAEPDPYLVFISEIMLQQTQAPRVAQLLPPFLTKFPTVQDLAAASNADVVQSWQGLGYNNRAIRLRDAARMIVERYQGVVPSSPSLLRELPGIGPYASAAISTFAFNTRVVVLDVNIRRVYSRLYTAQPHTAAAEADGALSTFAESLIPTRNPAEWHHAVMDLGATVCMARTTRCGSCPLYDLCPSSHLETSPPPPKSQQKRQEPSFRGEPRRLWRGRIVQALRAANTAVSMADIEDRVFGGLQPAEREFADDVVQRLQSDGLVVVHRGRLRLADGTG